MALVPVLAVFAAGCGGERTDVSGGVKQIEDSLQGQATLECPKEIDGGEGTVFDCTLKSTSGDTSEKVQLKVAKENGELAVAAADPKKLEEAVANVVSDGAAEEEVAPEEEAAPEEEPVE